MWIGITEEMQNKRSKQQNLIPPSFKAHTQNHKDIHKQRYADMFLYIPWDNEECFLGDSKSSIVCQTKEGLINFKESFDINEIDIYIIT